jgi:hypothetical protein
MPAGRRATGYPDQNGYIESKRNKTDFPFQRVGHKSSRLGNKLWGIGQKGRRNATSEVKGDSKQNTRDQDFP